MNSKLQSDSLVLYKTRPARVLSISDKIEIELQGAKTKRVRAKDVTLLHPGPLHSLTELGPRSGEIREAWELVSGSETDLRELTELIFSDYTPATAWAAWELVMDGLYFSGSPDAISGHPVEQVEQKKGEREQKVAAAQAWSGFLQRMEAGELIEEDHKQLAEVEKLALRRSQKSRIMQELGYQQSPEHAHRLLLKVGYWPPQHNPYPSRLGIALDDARAVLPDLPDEPRRDLTGLAAFAIDDEGNEDPDDAISLEEDRVWVHIADVAALVAPDSEADLEARARGANLYIPERILPMLPPAATQSLGLGLEETSPALSVGFSVNADAELEEIEVVLSRVRVTRLSYAEVNGRMDQEPFQRLAAITARFRQRRRQAGAAAIELPEARVRVDKDGEVVIHPMERTPSRDMVTDAMLMAGEAVARWALAREIPIPFAIQSPPDAIQQPADMAAMYAYRKLFKPSQLSVEPAPHAGLGLELYTRATSPLRRYSDLLVHQQLRAALRGGEPIGVSEIADRVAVAAIGGASIRKAERLSNRHWTLMYLLQHPKWQGTGQIVERNGQRATMMVPELAMEIRLRLRDDAPINTQKRLQVREVDLPDLTAYFSIKC